MAGLVSTATLLCLWVLAYPTASQATTENIFRASAAGDTVEVRRILESGVAVDAVDLSAQGDGQTALHFAMRAKDAAVANLLLRRGATVNAKARGGYTPLHVAAGLGRTEHVALLLKNGADVGAMDARGVPLHAAVAQGHAKAVALLLQAQADPNALTPSGKDTPLTLLYSITFFLPSHNAIVRQLVGAGADVNTRNAYGHQPFHAMVRADENTALFLLERGAMTKGMVMESQPITFAFARAGKLQVLERLLKEHPVREVDRHGGTLLHAAAFNGQLKVTAWLMSKGLDPNATTKQGATPLHYAAVKTNYEVMELLLTAGADANARDEDGQTPVYAALAVRSMARTWQDREDARQTVLVLQKHGAKLAIHDHAGLTPLSWYLRNVHIPGRDDVPQICDLAHHVMQAVGDASDRNGDGPLHSVARRSNFSFMERIVPPLAECLIRFGADPAARNLNNETPIEVAMTNRNGAGRSLTKFLSQPPGRQP